VGDVRRRTRRDARGRGQWWRPRGHGREPDGSGEWAGRHGGLRARPSRRARTGADRGIQPLPGLEPLLPPVERPLEGRLRPRVFTQVVWTPGAEGFRWAESISRA